MIRFEDLAAKVRTNNPSFDTEFLQRAYDFSAQEHKGQVRRSGEPYLSHPLEVAALMADMRLDVVAVAAALLHDVVEDTLTSIDRIQDLFGPEVAHLVEGVTNLSALHFSSSEERQAETFRKMLLAMVDDVRVILLKLADRLHNMRTLHHLSEDRRINIAQETLDIYAPIAYRLGMSKIRNELEELAFKYIEPKAHKALHAWVEHKRRATKGTVESLQQTIEVKLREAEIPIIQIDGRIKRLYSIRQKVKRQQLSLEEVYDLIALRVVTKTVRDCYAALGIIHQTWSPVPGRIKDFIAIPRPNGYQSLHSSVVSDRGFPFEVQIRTDAMHHIAEDGIAAHWKYKEGRVGLNSDEQYFQWLRQLLDWGQDVGDPKEFIRHLKVDLYPDEVYAFTPKGEVKALPRGSTPIDFAYMIHTDVGHSCTGAKVNGKTVPFRTKLKNGDIVEVVTMKDRKPNRDWLNFVVTSRARNRIKQFIHAEEKVQARELGRKIFEKEVRRYGLDFKRLTGLETLNKVATAFGTQKREGLLAAIGYGKVSAKQVLLKLVPSDRLGDKSPNTTVASVVRRIFKPNEDKIKVCGFDDLMVSRAHCCSPIKGEKIVGYITRGKGVVVHAVNCSNVLNSLYIPERQIEVTWDNGRELVAYAVQLTIQVEDRRGVLADITSKISNVKTNIKNVEATTSYDHQGQINLTIEIGDLKQLQKIVKLLKEVSGVLGVERAKKQL